MPRDAIPHNEPDIPTVADYPELGRELSLICESCGKKGTYQVGRVLIHPVAVRSFTEGKAPLEDAISFSGIFHCKHCGAAGPWKVPPKTSAVLIAFLTMPSSKQGEYGVQFGAMTLFDGTVARTGAEAEAYLKKKLEEQPQNAFIWGRLGNLYEHAGLLKQAKDAFERSVQLDPEDVESLYSLGTYRMDDGDWKSAAECFEAALQHAPRRPHRNPALMKKLVTACLQCLSDLHHETGGKVRFPPKVTFNNETESIKPANLGLMDLDLSSDEGWDSLASIYLTGKLPERMQQRAAKESLHRGNVSEDDLLSSEFSQTDDGVGTIRGSKRVGRNDPCPCGSGKKYKKCCLRTK